GSLPPGPHRPGSHRGAHRAPGSPKPKAPPNPEPGKGGKPVAHRSLATAVQGPDSGLYILWLTLPRPIRIPVGRLGTLALPAGLYAYVGSAQRRRSARIARHLRPDKPRRWHIDYVRPYGRVVAVSLVDGSREEECRLAQRLADLLGARVAA